jgi:hypothetical protein
MLPVQANPNAKSASITDDRIPGHLAQRFAVREENLRSADLPAAPVCRRPDRVV